MPAATAFQASPLDLLGSWRLRRRVHDRRAGGFGQMTGSLELAADGADVRWVELGTLSWAGRSFAVSRELRLVQDKDGWQVRFADGRPFHSWRPGDVVVHPCRADTYRGLIDLDAANTRLRILWDVTGPTKDQRLVTRCTRAGSAE